MEDTKRIIEINGVKVEIDLREAKTVDTYKVGDNVKVLIEEYNENFKSYPGVIVGFDNFEKRPTVIIAYLKTDYSSAELQFVYLNKDTKKVEIVPASLEDIGLEKSKVVDLLDKEILSKEEELREAKRKKEYFLKYFNKYFKG